MCRVESIFPLRLAPLQENAEAFSFGNIGVIILFRCIAKGFCGTKATKLNRLLEHRSSDLLCRISSLACLEPGAIFV